MEWKKIDSAPRDGAYILLYFGPQKGIWQGYWHQPGNPKHEGYWQTHRHQYRYATHWMALPKPPKEDEND